MDYDYHRIVVLVPVKNGWIRFAFLESEFRHQSADDLVPFVRRLFQAINCFEQSQYVSLSIFLFVFWRLLHINFLVLFKFSIEKSAMEVERVDLPFVSGGDGEDSANGGEASDGSERFIVVYSFYLRESFCDNSSLAFFDFPF